MKVLYIDCSMGIGGDMLSAALLELTPSPRRFLQELNALGIPNAAIERDTNAEGTRLSVRIGGLEEDEATRQLKGENARVDAFPLIRSLPLSEQVKEHALSIYAKIAEAESEAHGLGITEVHRHHVGALDAVVDVVSACLLIERLAPDLILASPVCTGFGEVEIAGGERLPVPTPATEILLRGVPTREGEVRGEMTTPTGAAIVTHFARDFCPPPRMAEIYARGRGRGGRDYGRPSFLRVTLGEVAEG